MKKILITTLAILILPSITAFAHQPRIPEGNTINIEEPEISKAYYAQLQGEPHIYDIESKEDFLLYVNILVPNLEGQTKSIKATIIKYGQNEETIKILDGNNFQWEEFFEPFGYDSYLKGPEFETQTEAGKYKIVISGATNKEKYALAIGKKEYFDFKETTNALKLIPIIKKDFFNELPANFILSPMGAGYILITFLLSFIFGFITRLVLRKFTKTQKKKFNKNISIKDRLLRAILGISIFLFAILTTWNPILLFISGFMLFQAIFSWCIIYSIMGKSSCPIN
jgi:hypothetical protein